MRARLGTVMMATALLLLVAAPAWACGFLVADNGAVRLVRTATLAGYVDGVEHYVTSFEFQGGGAAFGSIVPLPAVPTTVEKGGDWTLQRLARETQPVEDSGQLAFAGSSADSRAEVVLETQVEALDITILRGGGSEVVDWANDNGFDLGDGADELLSFYAERSPVFMAARFDVDRAKQRNQDVGDGTPIHLAIPTDAPWVPLRILGFDKSASEIVEADIYLLTERRPTLLPLERDGLQLRRLQPAGDDLLDDLRSDDNSGWVPQTAWLTYLRLNEEAGELTYDLAVSLDGDQPSRVDAGLVSAVSDERSLPAAPGQSSNAEGLPASWLLVLAGMAALGLTVTAVALRVGGIAEEAT